MTATNAFDPTVLADFVAHEAALLDAGRFDDWLALYTDDGRYWVPLAGAAQADPYGHQSLAFEDRLLLQLRIDRMKSPRAHSLRPRSRCQHVLQRSRIDAVDVAGRSAALSTPFLYIETRGELELTLAGTCRHRLVHTDAGWRMREKRVDLLDPERPYPAIQLFI